MLSRCPWCRVAPLLIILIVSGSALRAQEKSNKGTDFWLGFMAHIEGTNAGMSLYITSDSSTTGTVTVPGQSWSTTFSVTANNLTVVTIPSNVAYVNCSDCKQSKAVHVTSQKKVIVYAHHYEGNKSDATLVLPTQTQGKKYYVMAYEQSSPNDGGRSEFMVVAHKDSTQINITPTTDLLGTNGSTLKAGTTYTRWLNSGEVYQAQGRYGTSAYDVSGTYIEVIDTGSRADCRTVAVFSGSSYTRIGNCSGGFGTINSGDNLLEQMYPTTSWGKSFVIVPALGRASDNVRILAVNDNTQVAVYKSAGAPDMLYLDAGEYGEVFDVSTVRAVLANQPVMVAQFQKTSRCDGNNRVGDPSMTILNPLEQTLSEITLYSSQYFDIDNHYLNIVIPTRGTGSFKLDGKSISFSPVPRLTSWSYARVQVGAGNHHLKADIGFMATAYGEGDYESYGYAAGANVKDLITTIDVANSPMTTEFSNCFGTPTVFKGDAEYVVTKWEWDFGDGTGDSIQNPRHTYADTGSYTVILRTYKQQFDGCAVYDSAVITVNVYAPPTAILKTFNMCEGFKARLSDSSVVDQPEEYLATLWNINKGPDQYGRTLTKTFDSAGTYHLRMITMTTHQCRDTISDSIMVNPVPITAFSAEKTCFFDSTKLTNLTTVSTGDVVSNLWFFTVTDSSFRTNPSFFYADSGYHEVTLTSYTDSGCWATYTDTVYKYPKFEVSFTYNDTCFGFESEVFNTTTIEGYSLTDTVWYTSESDTFNTYHLSKTFGSDGGHWIQLIMEQDSYCRDTMTQNIAIHSLAVPNAMFSNLCFGDSTTFVDLTNYNGLYEVNWNLDDGKTSSDSIAYAVYSSAGNKEIILQINTEFGCSTSDTFNILITKPEILSLNLADVCENVLQTISANISAGYDTIRSYTWEIDQTFASNDTSFDQQFLTHGIKRVNLEITTENGCVRNHIDSIEVFDIPNASFTVSDICEGKQLIPVNLSSINSPYSILTNRWYLNGSLKSATKDPQITVTTPGTFDLKLEVVSNKGCMDSVTRSTTINPSPRAGFEAKNTCDMDLTELKSLTSIYTGSIVSYQWTVEGKALSGSTVDHTFSNYGVFDVYLHVRSDKGCTDSATLPVTIHPRPIIDISGIETEGCVAFAPTFDNLSSIPSGSIPTFTWNWGDGNSSNGFEPYHLYTSSGNYAVKVTATSDQGCVDSIDLGYVVTVHPKPAADFTYTPDMVHVVITEVVFTDASSNDVQDWEWLINGESFFGPVAKYTFEDAGQIPIMEIVTNNFGCKDTAVIDVFVNDSLFVYIPSAFSPNGTGGNETFGLFGITTAVTDMTMQIYNRWGELIFESTDPNIRWDGSFMGEPVQQGVYVYVVRYTNPQHRRWYYYEGEVLLLR